MKKSTRYKKLLVFIPLSLFFILLANQVFNAKKESTLTTHEAEERPHYTIDPEEASFYENISLHKQEKVRLKSTSTIESYANGKIRGNWSAKQFSIPNKVNYGFRMIGSAYDKEKDIVYVVSHAGHIWRIDYNKAIPTATQWTSMNHSHAFMTTSRKEWFDVLNISKDEQVTSRMLRSYNNKIEYSDDEGRNWQTSEGITFQETDDQGCITGSTQGERAVVLAKVDGDKEVAISYDGINYINCGLKLTAYNYDTKLLKPHNSDNVYIIARHRTTSKLSIYRMQADSESFTLLHSPSASVASPTRVIGTYTGSQYHFYYIINNENYYSSDEGATWTKTDVTNYGNTDGNSFVRTVHPSQASVLFRGYLDVYISNDKGASFSNWGHKLGWDVHHMRMYQRKDGSYMHLIGKDFGVFLSTTPEVRDSYFSINHSSPAQMQYDMTVSDNFNTAFSANQDRGSMSFDNSDTPTKTDIRTTDGLRVCLANNEKSIWTWMYFGTIYHTANEGYGSEPIKSIAYSGNWVAGSMSAHPDAEKDAIIIANEGQHLSIMSYDENKKTIAVEDHPFNFYSYTGQNVTSFGYSPINPNIWYAAVKDGAFLFSEDGGATFKKSLSGKLAKGNDQSYNYNRNQQVIKASKLDENKVFFAGVKNAFYISNNKGLLFKSHSEGLNVWRIRDFALSEDEKFIFAACGSAGPWVFSVDEDKWYPMDGPNVPYVDFTAVSYTPSKGMVQFGTYGYGILDFKFDRGDNTLQAPSSLSATAESFSSIKLNWNNANATASQYIIKRSSDLKTFEEIATIEETSFTDNTIDPNTTYYYRVMAKQDNAISLPSNLTFATSPSIELINNSHWKTLYVSSETLGNESESAYDKTSTTAWMSQSSAPFPQEISIDLGQEEDLAAFTYIPASTGIIKSYAFYASNDSTQWGNAISEGIWSNENDAAGIVDFTPTRARYVRLVAKSSFDGTQAGIAELQLWPGFDARLDAPVNLSTKVLSSTVIILKWENLSVNADGYIIERKADGEFEEIARVSSSLSSYMDKTLQPYTTYNYRITAYRNTNRSETSTQVEGTTSSTGLISNAAWQVLYKDSEIASHYASKAVDNNSNTWWSSTATALPHELQIDLGKEENITAFSYIPNTDSELGMIKDYAFYISNDKNNWGTAVAQGSWTSKQRQNVAFSLQSGRYIRLVASSTVDGGNTVSVAELMLWKSYAGTTALSTATEAPLNIYPMPFDHSFTIAIDEANRYHQAKLFAADGHLVFKQNIEKNTTQIRLTPAIEKGIYILRLEGNGTALSKTIIKK